MAIRLIKSPGIQINEIDKSDYTKGTIGTNVYLKGFTSKGEPYRPMEIASRYSYQQIYGIPENEAERYTYAAMCETLDKGGKLYMSRLPYDNDAFEKIVGLKYAVSYSNSMPPEYSTTGIFKEIAVQASAFLDVKNAAVIQNASSPALYDLSAIDEYRTDEAKVPADTFLIVDVTNATYGKVTEDYRKGKDRECIGIVPIVTTAANAFYAQNLIDAELTDIHNYEPLAGHKLNTLKADLANNGLLQSDADALFNTEDYFTPIDSETKLSTINIGPIEMLKDLKQAEAYAQAHKQVFESMLKQSCPDLVDGSLQIGQIYLSEEEVGKPIHIDINKIEDLRDSISVLMQYYGISPDHPLTNIKNLKLGIDQLIDAADDPPSPVQPLPNKPKIKDLKDKLNEILVQIGESLLWQAMVKFKVKCTPYHNDTNVPKTQSLDAINLFPTIQMADDGKKYDPEHLKDIGVVVFKMYLDPEVGNKVSYEIVEAFAGSLCKDDKDLSTGVTKFIDTIINSQSKYINFFSNCFNTARGQKFYKDECGLLLIKPSIGSTLGFYSDMTKKDISLSKSIFNGIEKCFSKVSDINKLDIDIVPDAGVSNIASYIKAIFGEKGPYDLSITDDLGNSLLKMWTCKKASDPWISAWKTVLSKYDNFCKNIRKDCMFIADGLRPLVLQGQKKTVRESKANSSIEKDILPFLPAICGQNTSYGAGYLDWFQQNDDYSGDEFWCPPSIKAMGSYIYTDLNFEYWDAPAGMNRGIVDGAIDAAFSPNGPQAGEIYSRNWNYAIKHPKEGIVLEGQKTFQTKPTALDRVNVRRTMLRLERQVYKTIRYFVYENNTHQTRLRLTSMVEPILKACWKGGYGGIARYKIICDESNNTTNVIDNNEMKIQICVIPQKSAEFIVCDFVVGGQSSSWEELLG